MSVKSLLQLILLLLIFLIIGGIYFLYFYSGTIKTTINDEIVIDQNNERLISENLSRNDEILEDLKTQDFNSIKKNEEKPNSDNIDIKDDELKILEYKNEKEIKKSKPKTKDKKKVENLTKEIEYITSNTNGDIFKITAKYGKTNTKNSNILDLEQVDGIISPLDESKIFISSNFAKYNYTNQNSKFYDNVKINFENKIITCDNLDLSTNENVAVAYGNVVVKDNKSVMKAQIVTMDIITKDININSNEKINILTK